jgi:hypothetical protein
MYENKIQDPTLFEKIWYYLFYRPERPLFNSPVQRTG